MDLYLEDLTRKRNEAAKRMQDIITDAEKRPEADRELTGEERANLEKFDADFTRYDAEEKRLLDMKERIGPAAERLAESVERTRQEDPDPFNFTSFFMGRADVPRDPETNHPYFDTMRTIPVGAQSSDPTIRALVEKQNIYAARALQSAGGSAIETSFANFVTVYERTLNPMMDVATVISTTDGSPIVLPRLTADAGVASGTVTAEAAGITEGDATISQVTLGAWKRAYTSLWSAELDQDNVIGLDQLIARSIGRQIGLAWGTAFTTGNDSSEANGFLNAIGTTVQLGTANGTTGNQASDNFVAASDLVDAFYALAAPYRVNASWMVSNSGLARMVKFRDSTGQFLYASSLVAGAPGTFLGRPVYENPAMATLASASISVAVGDFSAYIIRDVVPARVDRSMEYKFNTDQIAIRYITRRDGDLPDTTAIRAIRSANT
jgi:HK97 family phage major capsid protein